MNKTLKAKKTHLVATQEITVNCCLEEAFSFHADVSNIAKVVPSFIKIKITKLDWPFIKGAKAELSFLLFGFLPLSNWKLHILEFESNSYFIDSEESGLFSKFEHRHGFERLNKNSCLLTDTIYFQGIFCGIFYKLNPWLGELVDQNIIKPLLNGFLASKLQSTKTYLANKLQTKTS
jgi:ligand-binding SRPBCC domain-containing protein